MNGGSSRSVLAAGILGTVLAGIAVAGLYLTAVSQGEVEGRPYNRSLIGSDDPVDVVLSWSDAQATVALAQDPLLMHPETSGIGETHLAYRAQRPLLPVIVWATSGGGRGAGEALLVMAVLGGGMAAAGIAALLRGGRLSIVGGIAALILPGSLASIRGLGPELFGIGLAAAGIIAYRDGRIGRAVAAFAAIVLLRETFILVPVGLAAASFRREPRHAALVSIVPTLALVSWIYYIHVQTGAWSLDAGSDSLDVPFAGLRSLPQEGIIADAVALALMAILVLLAIRSRPDRAVAAILMVHLPLVVVMGPAVWRNWYDFSRPLLPMTAIALVIVVGRAQGGLAPRGDAARITEGGKVRSRLGGHDPVDDGTRAMHITD